MKDYYKPLIIIALIIVSPVVVLAFAAPLAWLLHAAADSLPMDLINWWIEYWRP